MLSFLVMAAATAPNTSHALDAVGGLSGCWTAPGTVRGKKVASTAKGSWHFGRRYFLLQLRSTGAARDYSAAIIYGAGQQPNTIGSYWLDTFGGTAPLPVDGMATTDGFIIQYHFPDSIYSNQFTRAGKNWYWTIKVRVEGRTEQTFAEYELKPTSCRGLKFDF